MRLGPAALAAAICLLNGSPSLFAQAPPRTDSDPTRPVLFSLRPEFYRIADETWRMQFIARYDTAAVRNRRVLGAKRVVLVRVELPVSTAATAASAANAGLGDAYIQALVVPRGFGRFTYVVGSGLSMPTATSDLLGSGKWTLAPVAAPLWIIRRGLAYVKVQDFVSMAGDPDRPDLHFLLITPTVIRAIGARSWLLVDSESKTDWQRDARTGLKSGVQLGRVVARGVGVWIKPEVWWGANRDGRWTLKTGVVWYR